MSKRRIPAGRAADRRDATAVPSFTPVPVRPRHDGWTMEKQTGFIEALAESGCVAHACQRVGMSPVSAYALRRRVDAQSFRLAWDFALDYAVQRLSDAALSRAIHGVAVPVFFQGEQIGERRYFDERLTRFLLRCRDPVRYGAWIDRSEAQRHPDGAAILLSKALLNLEADAEAAEAGEPVSPRLPLAFQRSVDPGEVEAEAAEARERARHARCVAEEAAYLRSRPAKSGDP